MGAMAWDRQFMSVDPAAAALGRIRPRRWLPEQKLMHQNRPEGRQP